LIIVIQRVLTYNPGHALLPEAQALLDDMLAEVDNQTGSTKHVDDRKWQNLRGSALEGVKHDTDASVEQTKRQHPRRKHAVV
jgi:hypothetical protein